MKRFHIACVLGIATLLAAVTVQAEERERPGACKSDVQKLCKGVQPGGGRIAACLKQHESEVSPECKKQVAEAKEEGRELSAACKADAEALCKGVQPGEGRVMRCLSEHQDKVSAGCRQKLAETESRHPCMKDKERLCKDVKPGEGRIAACLKQHESELSPECKAKHARK
jgi:hypothetical protein